MGNINPPMSAWQAFTPALIGATDNPVPTYSNQLGRFIAVAGLLFFKIRITSTTMTKTTLTDLLAISLPFPVAGVANEIAMGSARIENSTPIQDGTACEMVNGNSFINFRSLPNTTASLPITYAVTSPGIGVLTNTINFVATGFYEF